MLEIDVFTLFPDAFAWLRESRPLRNAAEAGSLRLRMIDLRDHALGGYRQVDDAPYGGGAGHADPRRRRLRRPRGDLRRPLDRCCVTAAWRC